MFSYDFSIGFLLGAFISGVATAWVYVFLMTATECRGGKSTDENSCEVES